MKTPIVFALGLAIGAGGMAAQGLFKGHDHQPYKDEQGRAISSLSAKDVAELKKGAGWGLAKPAEFNGYPGPLHVLEFADKMDLAPEQKKAIEASFAIMRAKAKELGAALIEAEAALDEAFKAGGIDEAALKARLADAEAARAKLRNVHLAAHLEITPLLTEAQKIRYAELRGYAGGHTGH